MVISPVRIATESEEGAVIDALKLAFVVILLLVGSGHIRRSTFYIFLNLLRLLEENRLFIRPLTILEIIRAQLFGYLQKLTLMLIQYSDYYKIPHLKMLKSSFQRCSRKWAAIIQMSLIGICHFLELIHFIMAKALALPFWNMQQVSLTKIMF